MAVRSLGVMLKTNAKFLFAKLSATGSAIKRLPLRVTNWAGLACVSGGEAKQDVVTFHL